MSAIGNILSKREQQIFELIVSGMPRKEVSRVLGISVRTINVHIANIRRKSSIDGTIRIE